ncbi:MAG: hypothetical protein QNJ17_12340 [Desulfocapsaceae bacterium]|nr:hypothetical protein [Desulfocapsaceae bacterium]
MATGEQLKPDLPFRPLGVVKKTLDSLGVEVSYVYEDLVFITHNHFLLQFGEVGTEIFFYHNVEIKPEEASLQHGILATSFAKEGIALHNNGSYSMIAQDDGTISLSFSARE